MEKWRCRPQNMQYGPKRGRTGPDAFECLISQEEYSAFNIAIGESPKLAERKLPITWRLMQDSEIWG